MLYASQIEHRLIQKAKRGDKAAFDDLVLQYQPRLSRILSRYFNEPSDIADVSQEVMIKIFRSLKNFRGDSSFYTWIYRITVNTAKTYLINQGRRPPGSDMDIEDAELFGVSRMGLKEISTPEGLLMRDDVESILFKTLEMLPDELRTTLMLRELEGLSYEEIADLMNCPIGTVRSRIFRARDVIDTELAPLLKN